MYKYEYMEIYECVWNFAMSYFVFIDTIFSTDV